MPIMMRVGPLEVMFVTLKFVQVYIHDNHVIMVSQCGHTNLKN